MSDDEKYLFEESQLDLLINYIILKCNQINETELKLLKDFFDIENANETQLNEFIRTLGMNINTKYEEISQFNVIFGIDFLISIKFNLELIKAF